MDEAGVSEVFRVLDLTGVFASALLGGVIARQAKLDPIGFAVLAVLSGLGGGLIRDVLLQHGPPVALTDYAYLLTAFAGAAVSYLIRVRGRVWDRVWPIVDALALGTWAAAGAQKTLGVGLGWLAAILLGTITAVGGGAVRDVVLRRIPGILGGNTLYATCAIVGERGPRRAGGDRTSDSRTDRIDDRRRRPVSARAVARLDPAQRRCLVTGSDDPCVRARTTQATDRPRGAAPRAQRTNGGTMTAAATTTAVLAGLDRARTAAEDFYRHLHQHPELSHQETDTAAAVIDRLKSAGYDVTSGVGGTGVIGILRNGDGPTVLLRADMDALPVHEETGLAIRQHDHCDRWSRHDGPRDARVRARRPRHHPAHRGGAARSRPGPLAAAGSSCCSNLRKRSATVPAAWCRTGSPRSSARSTPRSLNTSFHCRRASSAPGAERCSRPPTACASPCTAAERTAPCPKPRSTPSCSLP